MSSADDEDTRAFWNDAAQGWDVQVGDAGDSNRILNSDPVLWRFVGDVSGVKVLDAGCGTGYLSRRLQQCGAQVTGIDFSASMIAIARARTPAIDYRVDSCTELASIADASFAVVVSNYVLMDVPDLDGALRAFYRVLAGGGSAVRVFSHPCFPQGRARAAGDGQRIQYDWEYSYFEHRRDSCPPWGHFTTDFIWFHRPLSSYWKAFLAAGFEVVDFDEPHVTAERYHLADSEHALNASKTRPYSVAFKLRKPAVDSMLIG